METHTLVIFLSLGRQSQEDSEFQAFLSFIVRPNSNNRQQQKQAENSASTGKLGLEFHCDVTQYSWTGNGVVSEPHHARFMAHQPYILSLAPPCALSSYLETQELSKFSLEPGKVTTAIIAYVPMHFADCSVLSRMIIAG